MKGKTEAPDRTPPKPPDEAERLATLRLEEWLNGPPDAAWASVVALLASLLDVPIAAASIMEADRQRFLAAHGTETTELPRDIAFCAHTVASGSVLVGGDTSSDRRFSDNPLVVAPPYIRAYAGAPLTSPDGLTLGTLFVLDTLPRSFTERDVAVLGGLASHLSHHLALLGQLAHQDLARARHKALLQTAVDAIVTIDERGTVLQFNPSAERLFGQPSDRVLGRNVSMLMPPPSPGNTIATSRPTSGQESATSSGSGGRSPASGAMGRPSRGTWPSASTPRRAEGTSRGSSATRPNGRRGWTSSRRRSSGRKKVGRIWRPSSNSSAWGLWASTRSGKSPS